MATQTPEQRIAADLGISLDDLERIAAAERRQRERAGERIGSGYRTREPIEYKAAPYGFIAVIPAGTECIPATNRTAGGYWACAWGGMSDRAESWLRNYGFLIDAEDVDTL